jgi:nucleotide-binding universal stress UspA family protein
MFDHIMVPLDGSELAERALLYARELAAATNATLHLVRVVDLPSAVKTNRLGAPVNVYAPVIDAQREEANAYLEEARAHEESAGRSVTVQRLDGDAATVLLDYVREAGIDTVVMTSHGGSGLTRWALGTVADRVTRGGTVPVLLVPSARTSALEGG